MSLLKPSHRGISLWYRFRRGRIIGDAYSPTDRDFSAGARPRILCLVPAYPSSEVFA